MNATPTKRRALGSLDLNISRSPQRSPSSTKFATNKGLVGLGGSPLKKKKTTTPTKRPFLSVHSHEEENEGVLLLPAAKKLCSDAKVVGHVSRPKVTVEDADEVCCSCFCSF